MTEEVFSKLILFFFCVCTHGLMHLFICTQKSKKHKRSRSRSPVQRQEKYPETSRGQKSRSKSPVYEKQYKEKKRRERTRSSSAEDEGRRDRQREENRGHFRSSRRDDRRDRDRHERVRERRWVRVLLSCKGTLLMALYTNYWWPCPQFTQHCMLRGRTSTKEEKRIVSLAAINVLLKCKLALLKKTLFVCGGEDRVWR